MSLRSYILRRLLVLVPQLFGIIVVTFFILRLIPGNAAEIMAGGFPTKESIAAIERHLGLDKPVWVQFLIYLQNLSQGDLGQSWVTSNPVAVDIVERFPSTVELITLGLGLAMIVGVSLGVATAMYPRSLLDRGSRIYTLLAGAVPDFWVALLLILVFFVELRWTPPPLGPIGLDAGPTNTITGIILIDALLSGDLNLFGSAASHLVLPVLTLGLVFSGPVAKMTNLSMTEALRSDYTAYARVCGLRDSAIMRYAFKAALPPVVTFLGVLYGFVLGGAILVEQVFSWGGFGQYAVQSVVNKDYAAVQGFMLVAGVWSILIYLLVDLLYFALDPRIRR